VCCFNFGSDRSSVFFCFCCLCNASYDQFISGVVVIRRPCLCTFFWYLLCTFCVYMVDGVFMIGNCKKPMVCIVSVR